MMLRVSLTSCSSKSRETVSAKTNETMPSMISRGRFMAPKTRMNPKVKAALKMPMMNERMTK